MIDLDETESEQLPSASCDASASCLAIPKRASVKADELPLPDPYPLPRNYRADVEVALKTGKMTAETSKSFYSSVAGSMLTFKRYPTKEEFARVATDIIRKYPFLKSQSKSPIVSDTICIL